MENKSYICRYCGNEWSVEEGFNLQTGQCAACQQWDDSKEEREAECQRRIDNTNRREDFPYVAGDPYW